MHAPAPRRLRLAFALFHLTIALVVFVQSAETIWSGAHGAAGHASHAAVVVGGLEALGALLFLAPRTLHLGAGLLLATFAVATLAHGLQPALLVYAAGVVFVWMHGSAWGALRNEGGAAGAPHA